MNFIKKLFKKNKKVETIRDVAVRALYPIVADYSDWYDEAGLALPPDFIKNPSEWNEELHKMVRALELLHDELNGEGELYEANNKWNEWQMLKQETMADNLAEIERLNAEVRTGLEALGKQLFYLTDPQGEYPKKH